MSIQLLIDGIVRQTTVLIAQLATSGGARAPLSRIAGQVFLDLANELQTQGVSRKVSADMFGLALRTYQRKTQRLRESQTEQGRSLWTAVFDYLGERGMASRREVLERFHRDEEALVRGVLHDLTETGLVFFSGRGARSVYRIANDEELGRLHKSEDELDALLWATIYRAGPISRSALLARCTCRPDVADASLARLCASGRVSELATADGPSYRSDELVIAFGDSAGWEAAVLDHFQALVRTICQKLAQEPSARPSDTVGGSTYTFLVWDGHPHQAEAMGQLARFRREQSELRTRIDAYNDAHEPAAGVLRVITYGGQCVLEDTSDSHTVEEST
ncbi:MAG TPA: hypothetical protein VJR89_13815 [Polyangiales bacterium]|nr:hypothetical protein [Polyangiales bacterium]